MAGVRGLAILVVVVLVCVAEAPGFSVANEYDGLPRPAGYNKTPTEDYGPTPPCYLNEVVVTCDWYGFSHVLYPLLGADCLTITREALANTTAVPPGTLVPYSYYFLDSMVFNTANNASYCLYGCFDMSATSPSSAPLASAPVPSTTETPPPALISPPAPDVLPPVAPPATAPATAPAATPPATPPAATPPAATPPAATPPAVMTSPPAPTAVAPPPPGPHLFNLNGAGLLQPTGLVSFIVSGALLIFHGLVGF